MSTIIDVAREAGVSPMTVSRYFNQPDLLSARTYERVRTAVEALGYVPNLAARSLVQGRTNIVALVVSNITNPFFTTIARGVEDAAQAHGYTLILGNTDETAEKERQYLEVLVSRRVDGVILSPSSDGEPLHMLDRHQIPVVLVDRKLEGFAADVVWADSFAGGRLLTEHLLEQGYRDIAFVGGKPGVPSLEARLGGYRSAMEAAGCTPSIHLGRYDASSGQEVVDAILELEALPEALIAANNLVAVGALGALRAASLRVPDDIALVCFDDFEVASLLDPALTVAAQPAYEIGRQAMEMLIERMDGLSALPREHRFPFELIVRESSGVQALA